MPSTRKAFIRYIVFCSLCIVLFAVVFHFLIHSLDRHVLTSYEIDSGWNVSINGELFENISISNFDFPVTKEGDVVEISQVLDIPDIRYPVLRFMVFYSVLDVFVDGELVYSYGHDIYAENRNPGCGPHYIKLGEGNCKKDFRARLLVTEKNSFSSLKKMHIEEASESYTALFRESVYVLGVGFFLLLLGILGMIGSFVIKVLGYPMKKIFSVSATTFGLGLFILFHNNIMDLFFSNYSLNSWIEHISIFFVNYALTAIVYIFILNGKREKFVLRLICYIYSVYVVIALVLDALNIMHLPEGRVYFIVIMFTEVLFAICFVIRKLFTGTVAESITSAGILFMMILIAFEFAKYVLVKYTNFLGFIFQGSFTVVGALLFVVNIAQSYLMLVEIDAKKTYADEKIKEQKGFDYLTGLYNADICQEQLQAVAQSGNSNSCVICIRLIPVSEDAPNVETLEGGEFIKLFSGYMQGIFSNYGFLCRLDKMMFCVVAHRLAAEKISRFERMLKDLLFSEMQKKPKMQYALHLGSAFFYEEENPTELYKLAETRMKEKAFTRH